MPKKEKLVVIKFTPREADVILAAAGNIDPCMFLEDVGGKEGELDYDAWLSGMKKLEYSKD